MKITKYLFAFLAMGSAFANGAPIDSDRSVITATFKQIGVEVTAKFTSVSGKVDFDPANPAGAKANIAVALSGFDLGEPEYNKEVQKKEWFDTARFPQATFVSSDIKLIETGKFMARGWLAIKGKVLEVSVPVVFSREGQMRVFDGQLPIRRLYFAIGEGEWKDTDTLADEVMIRFRVVTSN